MNVITRIRLMIWKRRLRKAYKDFAAVRDEYDCGDLLACHISSRAFDARRRMNEAIRQCVKLDPDCKLREME